jgi:DtxR family Mn-dependent transcriptional regulator
MISLPFIVSLLIIAVLLFWPDVGVVARWREARRRALRVRREDALKHVLKCEVNGQVPTLNSVAGALHIRDGKAAELLADMEAHGLITLGEGRLRLRQPGRELALHVVRAHRLWESYLAEQTGVAEAKWHHLAERKEHQLSPEDTIALAARLGNPLQDPHGDTIPAEGADLPADIGQPLNTAPLDTPVLISHIEDEPEAVYKQIQALGLRPGVKACIFSKENGCIRFWADGREHVLTPILANNLTYVPLPGTTREDLFDEEFLSGLQAGERARMLGLSTACRGAERRRLLDLGFVPGTMIEVDLVSPAGDPTAYRVRGTVIALRREQARLIRIGNRETIPMETAAR